MSTSIISALKKLNNLNKTEINCSLKQAGLKKSRRECLETTDANAI